MLDLGEQNWLTVAAELNPRNLFDHFLKSPDAARHCDKGVRQFKHLALALMHVAGDDQVVGAAHRMFARNEKLRNDAGHRSAALEHRLGTRPHPADSPA